MIQESLLKDLKTFGHTGAGETDPGDIDKRLLMSRSKAMGRNVKTWLRIVIF